MSAVRGVPAQLLALFVDDGSLVLAVIAWALVVAIGLSAHLFTAASMAVLLSVGIAALLAENIVRTASVLAARSRAR